MKWDDPAIVGNTQIDEENPILRAAAEAIHRNESLHRHDPSGPTCVYCALNAARALAVVLPELEAANARAAAGWTDSDHDVVEVMRLNDETMLGHLRAVTDELGLECDSTTPGREPEALIAARRAEHAESGGTGHADSPPSLHQMLDELRGETETLIGHDWTHLLRFRAALDAARAELDRAMPRRTGDT